MGISPAQPMRFSRLFYRRGFGTYICNAAATFRLDYGFAMMPIDQGRSWTLVHRSKRYTVHSSGNRVQLDHAIL
jgi:hypothetical protein